MEIAPSSEATPPGAFAHLHSYATWSSASESGVHQHLASMSYGGTPKALDLVDPALPYLASGALTAHEAPTLRFPGPRLFFSSFTLSQAG